LGYDPSPIPLAAPKATNPQRCLFIIRTLHKHWSGDQKTTASNEENLQQFAKELGVDVKTLRNWETNRHEPSDPLFEAGCES